MDYLGQSGTIWNYLGLSGTIWDYLGLSGTIQNYLGLSRTITDYLGQSGTILDYLELHLTISYYLELSPEAIARPYNFETFCVTHPETCAGHRGARAPKNVMLNKRHKSTNLVINNRHKSTNDYLTTSFLLILTSCAPKDGQIGAKSFKKAKNHIMPY